MTGREVAAAVRPLEITAKAILRFAELAHEAIRLEEGTTQATAALTATRQSLEDARVELAILQSEAKNLTATLAAERAASETETLDRCAGMVAEAEALAAKAKQQAEAWAEKSRSAAVAHDVRVAEYRTETSALQAHLDGLREQARTLAQKAGAVLR
jgi:predicted  nucleic acid-binding Zn-ribbon protein